MNQLKATVPLEEYEFAAKRIAQLEAQLKEAGESELEWQDYTTKLEAALTLLTNGFKYSTEVVTIARNALAAENRENDNG